jgi:hypothetical protein
MTVPVHAAGFARKTAATTLEAPVPEPEDVTPYSLATVLRPGKDVSILPTEHLTFSDWLTNAGIVFCILVIFAVIVFLSYPTVVN